MIDLKVRNSNINNFSAPVIKLSSQQKKKKNTEKEHNHLKYGLKYCIINRNKNVKKYLSAELETLAQQISDCIEPEKLEENHEFLRGYADIFSNNIYNSKDYTYDLKLLIKNKNIKVLQGDKDFSVIMMDSEKYYKKLETMVNENIKYSIYKETIDTTLHDLKLFQDFLYRNFKYYKDYEKIRPVSDRLARLYASAKTHKFDNVNDVTLDQLKFRPIMDQTGTYTYNAAQVISNYLKPLCTNEYNIKDTLQLPQPLKNLPPLKDDEEYVSYDVESLFTNIPLKETIGYILEQIYVHNKLPIVCSKSIFRRLLEKTTTENSFQLNSKFFKQTDGCANFYKKYVDDIINRRKKHEEDLLFKKLNEYHPKIKLTIKINPPKFLDTEIIILNNKVATSVHRKEIKLPVP